MNEDISQVIEEKFTRCPECRSYSVKQTMDLTLKEKITSFFIPVKVQRCDNCSYRFVEYEKFSTALKHLFRSLTSNLPGKCVVIAAPIVVVAIVLTIIFISGSKEKESLIPVEKKPVHVVEDKPETKIEEKPEIEKIPQQTTSIESKEKIPEEKNDSQEKEQEIQENQQPPPPIIAGEIVLGNSNRFGVNWRPLGEGVQITRLSPGSLKKAGLLTGDILIEVGGKKVIGEGVELEKARDDVFYNKRTEVLIKVMRGEEILLFKMVKWRK
jgi:hypothetical protein